MTWGLVFAGVSAAAGAFNALDEQQANRQIRSDLKKIKRYLVDLRATTNKIVQQNNKILIELDELPSKIQEIVDISQLREKYSVVDDVRDNFLLLRSSRRTGVRQSEWIRLSEAMGYLFEHEYRISKTFRLIGICEIALVVTKERSLPIVRDRVESKIAENKDIHSHFSKLLEASLAKLKAGLDNSVYVKSHNLSEELPDLDQLEYKMMPNRMKQERYNERVCRRVEGRYAPRTECKEERRTRTVVDRAYVNRRNRHKSTLEKEIAEIQSEVIKLGYLEAAISSLQKYLQSIQKPTFKFADFDNPTFYFWDDESDMAADKSDRKIIAKVDDKVEDDFEDYIDGCSDDCDEVAEGLTWDRDNGSFNKNEHC